MGIMMAMFFVLFIRWADKNQNIQQLEFDLDTITAQDYTIEFKIDKEIYRQWKDENETDEAPAIALKADLNNDGHTCADDVLDPDPTELPKVCRR